MKPRLPAVLAALGIIALGGFAAGCGDDGGGDGGRGQLTVGSDVPFPPFEQGKAPDYEGFDIDVMNEIAKRLGRPVTYQDSSFDTIFTDLASGKFDLVIAASTITADREKTVDFSDPYYQAQQALFVAPDSDITSTDQLAGRIVAAQDGTTGEDYVNDETDAASVNGFPTGPEAIRAVVSGQADAGILDQPAVKEALERQGGFKVAQTISTDELYGIAFPPESDRLREDVNGVLEEIKDDGTLQKLYEKWFPGVTVPDSVLDGTNDLLE